MPTIQINTYDKPVAFVINARDRSVAPLTLRLLQSRAAQARADIAAGNLVNDKSFFDCFASV